MCSKNGDIQNGRHIRFISRSQTFYLKNKFFAILKKIQNEGDMEVGAEVDFSVFWLYNPVAFCGFSNPGHIQLVRCQ
jgi:hypothetical protein